MLPFKSLPQKKKVRKSLGCSNFLLIGAMERYRAVVFQNPRFEIGKGAEEALPF